MTTKHDKIQDHIRCKDLARYIKSMNHDCTCWIEGDYLCAGYRNDHTKFKIPATPPPEPEGEDEESD